MDIKHFAILEWVERDLLLLQSISSCDNAADHFTKPLVKQLLHSHTDTIMGRRIPAELQSKWSNTLGTM